MVCHEKKKYKQGKSTCDLNEKNQALTRSQAITQAAINAGFQSREPNLISNKNQQEKTPLRRRRTGRNAQFNLKARPETIAAFCNIADQQSWGLGETLEKAVELLELNYSKK